MSNHSVLDLLDTAWSGSMNIKSLQDFSPRSVNTCSLYTTTTSDSFELSADEESLKEADVKAVPGTAQPIPTRAFQAVHKISPLVTFTPQRVLAFANPRPASPPAPLAPHPPTFTPAPSRKVGKEFQKGPSSTEPVPIPGAIQDNLERQTSLIKAVPGPTLAFYPSQRLNLKRGVAPQTIAPAVGSWTQRQVHYPVDQPDKQPAVPKNWASSKAKAAKVRAARAAEQSMASLNAGDKLAKEIAWRFRFKKKWIREELFARKMEFPEDPGYDDQWADALDFIEACGPTAALQAAFLETSSSQESEVEDDVMDATDCRLLQEEEGEPFHENARPLSRETSIGPEVAAKAAMLVRMQQHAVVV